jgi:hypothetical protein
MCDPGALELCYGTENSTGGDAELAQWHSSNPPIGYSTVPGEFRGDL